jgi:hypothetical protein
LTKLKLNIGSYNTILKKEIKLKKNMTRSYYCKGIKEMRCETTGRTIEMEIGDLWGEKLIISPNCDILQKDDYCGEIKALCPYKQMKTSILKEKFFPEIYTSNFKLE